MEAVFRDVEFSIVLLKLSGILLSLVAVSYLLCIKNLKRLSVSNWKSVIILSCVLALLNAGLTVAFGKGAFFITPLFVFLTIALWLTNKLPSWKKKHLIAFITSFTSLSICFFVGVAGFFFHLAV
jgi:Flp pilus assembly protein protease CpaA